MPTRAAFPAVVAVGLAVIGASPGIASTPATARIVTRPVTQTGTPARGVLVATDAEAGSVSCTPADPSPGAVSRNIEFCSPSSAYAIACWKSATPHRVLCSRDPSSDRVYSLRRSGSFASSGLAPKRNRAPLLLVLGNGWRCLIRDGGAWSNLQGHPNWFGTYSCNNNHDAVWSPPNAPHSGINESQATWTVHVAPISGRNSVTVRTVRKAYFVGTHP
jgi:hypothetical protein